jgi:hypothetical protein
VDSLECRGRLKGSCPRVRKCGAREQGRVMLGGGRPLRAAPLDSHFLHLANKRGARQAEPHGGTVLTANQPIGLFQHL